MDFVIFSPHFFPMRDPEAYCATRFASALAAAGHQVRVVALGLRNGARPGDYSALVHPDVTISYVERTDGRTRWPHIDLRTMTVCDNDILEIPGCVARVKAALASCEKPILITRAEPPLATYVGYVCRRDARLWVAHFSDPVPWIQLRGSLYNRVRDVLKRASRRVWMRRAFRTADGISVTCPQARRFFREAYGPLADRLPWVVTTHIGDYKLQRPGQTDAGPAGKGVILHSGDMYLGRGIAIIEAVERLNGQGCSCAFIQDRQSAIDGTIDAVEGHPHCHVIKPGCDPALHERAAAAQVTYVEDFPPMSLSYSPRLLSKFVYQVYENRPLVVSALEDSEMADLCRRHPEAGLFFARLGDGEALCRAVREALAADPATFDRSAIRREFAEEAVAETFLSFVRGLEDRLK